MGSDPSLPNQLPKVDFSQESLKPGTDSWVSTTKAVREALEDYGCLIAVCDRVSAQLEEARVFGALEELFDLPLEAKMKNKYEMPFNGYVGQLKTLPLHESLGIGDATSFEATQSFTRRMWPSGNDHFCGSIHSFAKVAEELDQIVTKMIFESYGLGEYYESHIGSITYLLRVIKSRPPRADETSLSLMEHTDKSFTTMLFQDHVNGLEVKTKDGNWIKVEFSPPNFVVIAGDAFKAWSNNRIASPEHKVVMKGEEERYSLGLFGFSNGKVEVPEELVDEDHPLQFRPFDHLGLLRFFHSDEGRKAESALQAYCGTGV